MEIGRLIATFEADITKFEAGRKQVESGMQKTAASVNQSQKKIADGELSMEKQMAAVASLQRQRSAALIRQWRDQERAAAKAAQGGRTFKDALDGLSRSIATMQGPLGGVAGRVTSIGSLFAELSVTSAGVAVGLGAIAAAAVGAMVAIFKLTTSVAEQTGKFVDLSQATGFSVETLSALQNAAETSGGSIETVSGALGIFQRHMIEAQEQGSEMSKVFKQLSIDTSDNEKALRQAIEQLRKMPEGAAQTALAMKLFGRSGREVLALIKEMDTDLDSFMGTLREAGILIGTDTAKAGDQLSDSMVRLNQQFAAVQRLVAQEFAPTVLTAVQDLTKLIVENKAAISGWATYFMDAARGAKVLVDAVLSLNGSLAELAGIGIPDIIRFLAPGGLSGLSELGRLTSSSGAGTPFTRNARPAFRTPNFSPFRPSTGGGGGGGGRGGGRGGGGVRTDPGIQLLKQLQDEYKDLTGRTELQAQWEKLLGQAYAKTSDEMKKKIYIQKADNIAMKEAITQMEKFVELVRELGEKREKGFFRQRRAFGPADLTEFFHDTGATRPRSVAAEQTRPRTVASGLTRPRIATELEEATRRQYQEHIERIRDLAVNLTSILDRAIFDGFEGGIKRGFQSLTLGILDLVKNVFLKQLENAMVNAFSGIGGGGKGGLLSGIFSALIGAVAGGFGGGGGGFVKGGGGGGFAGKFQSGGLIPSGSWGVVHDNERVFATPFGAQVVPSHGGSGGAPTIIINVPVRSAGSYSSSKSRRQLAEDITAALQGSLA